ncbi:DUF6776 family protein [Halopseudomonas pelagia]|uniref:Uncharacterized protein n=1 Tax=Halopseudomonas pelagia TaxID=553151 RepID=A0AA91TZG4_9GAMM|nr:DUF6776 family protein [Halopseudomonas pelagia]PCC97391.1 hypothetical protein CO192_21070 [Halopseudomonas pelagia]QFY55608.1 hypothetical protein EAO82_03980 [Halopseudomonas pelagia]
MFKLKRRRVLRDHRVVFIPRTSRLVQVLKVGLIVTLLLASPLSAWFGWEFALRSQQAVLEERDQLLVRQLELASELDSARQSQQQMEVDLLVAREGLQEARDVVQELEQQLFRVQQDLAQYQGALAPNAMLPGLRIQAFELHATEAPNTFRYKVMVSRVGEESDTVQARLDVTIHGRQGGEAVTLTLDDVTGDLAEDVMSLNFRYFQVVPSNGSGAELVLPDDFQPERVILKAVRDGKTLVEQAFDWTVTGARP